jgi:hypothetical protein
MYAGREEARSDLMLAAAAYLFGPLFVGLLLSFVPLLRVPVLGEVLLIALPLVFTILVPVLLIRYRHEKLSDYGLGDGPDPSVLVGLLAGLPLVGAGLLAALARYGDPSAALPMFPAGRFGIAIAGASPILITLERLARWVGLVLLALYVSVKAREAFGSAPLETREAVRKVGVIIAVGGAVTTVIVLLTTLGAFDAGRAAAVLLGTAAVAGAVFVAVRRLGTDGSTVLPAFVVPVLILALGPFRFTFQAVGFLNGLYGAALYAGVGLVVALLVERSRRGLGVVMFGLVIASLTVFGPAGFLA